MAFDVEVEEIAQSGTAEASAPESPKKEVKGAKNPAESQAQENSQIHRARTPKTPKKKEAPEKPKVEVSADNALLSPMPGTVLDICVSPGDEVYAGETLVILEAMKMENEINSHKTGRIAEIFVKTGDSVNTGELLLTVE